MSAEKPPLPRLLLIADGFASGRDGRDAGALWMLVEQVQRLCGVRFIMLRDHQADDQTFTAAADVFSNHIQSPIPMQRSAWRYLPTGTPEQYRKARFQYGREREPWCRLVVNGRPEAARTALAGLHVGARGPSVASVAGQFPLVGYSAHGPEEAAQAARDGADYVLFSPVFPTPSKPDHPGVGLDSLAEAVQAAYPAPVFALGGITPGHVKACLEAGAHGVAVLSGILDASDPVAAACDYQAALKNHA